MTASRSQTRRAFLGAAAGAARAAGAPPARRPNIVLIMADDLGFSDLGCYGSEIATPNLDALARRGVRFTQFYNNARCCPSRASLLTGLYPHQAGIGHMTGDYRRPGYRGRLGPNCATIAEALRPAGYRNLMVGKWHVAPFSDEHRGNWPLARGFDRYYGNISGAASYYAPFTLMRDGKPVEPEGKDYFYTGALGENAAAMIRECAGKPAPFFLYAAFTAPHWPLHAPAPEIDRLRDRYRQGYEELRVERFRRMLSLGILDKRWPLSPRGPAVPPWTGVEHKEWESLRMVVYAAQVSSLDRAVGRILAALRETGAEENTLVMFLSDNGGAAEVARAPWKAVFIPEQTRDGRPVRGGADPGIAPGPEDTYQSYGIGWAHASNTPFRAHKRLLYEGGIAAPLIAAWPGRIRARGDLISAIAHITDLMPTCLDAAGAKYPARRAGETLTPPEGRSLVPLFEGRGRPQADVFWEHEGHRALRRGRYKLVSRYKSPWELYDMEEDRTELRDLSSEKTDMVRGMARDWEAWAARVGVVPWKELEPIQYHL